MNTFASLRYHLIFRTLDGALLLTPSHRADLCRYVDAIVKKKRGMLLESAALPNHAHFLLGIRPSLAIADMVRDLKANSSRWLNENGGHRGWFQWEPGYGAFTVSESEIPRVRRFIRRQHEYHETVTLEEEFVRFVEMHGMEYDPNPGARRRYTYAWQRIHVIFSTKLRMPLIPETVEQDLYQTFSRLAAEQGAELVEAGGIADHVHLVLAPHRSVPIANLLRSIKSESTAWLHEQLGSETFFAWQRGYGVFSVSLSQLSKVRQYVLHQKEHHQSISTEEEFRRLLTEHGLDTDSNNS